MILHYIVCLVLLLVSSNASVRKIPDGLQFGVATAAYQVEGGWNASDKTKSIWDHICHINSSYISDGTNGDVACNSYNNYKRDVQMIKDLGVDFYRSSVSWPRILPNGFDNYVSQDGYNYYNNIIDELLKNNIQPVITIYHWDIPQRLQNMGGWANPLVADWFEDYARVLFRLFGDRVKTWITINEPKQMCVFGYGQTVLAPALGIAGIAEYLCAKHVLLAHARAWHLYNDTFRPIQRTDLYSHPIFSQEGGFPERVVRRIKEKSLQQGYSHSRLPTLSEHEKEYIRGSSDFYGFNHYSTAFYYRNASVIGAYEVPSYSDDIGASTTYLENTYTLESPALSWLKVIPWGIRKSLNSIRTKYNNPVVKIFENGFSTYKGLVDDDRITYHREYLNSILDAIEIDGCNVVAYTAWSLMDNFQWSDGFRVKFGIFEVDFESEERTRTPRKSAYVFQEIVKSRVLDTDFQPTYPTGVTY